MAQSDPTSGSRSLSEEDDPTLPSQTLARMYDMDDEEKPFVSNNNPDPLASAASSPNSLGSMDVEALPL